MPTKEMDNRFDRKRFLSDTPAYPWCVQSDDAEHWTHEAWDDEDIIVYEGEWEDLLRSGK
jgi:hypothetical protein